MGDWGCPLDMAFNTGPTQQISIKKSKKKKRKDIIQPEELKVSDYSENVHKAESDLSQMKQKLQQIKAFDDEYNIYEPIRRQQYIREEPQNEEQKKQISNEEYQAFKEYQLQRYQKNRNVVEHFSNMNDDFNDIILFALTGIFFIIFTDYIYKLGKKSY
tara:strand:+ start:106 stop:582 length:477 start_codon:yes stop_codon:yes gene_type:complete